MKLLRAALVLFALLTLVTGVLYPFAVTGVAQVLFPGRANGSLISHGGKIVGSELIGQEFTGNNYFWSRPSATGDHAYNGMASGGSNLGPLNDDLKKTVADRVTAIRAAHPDQAGAVPVDLVTASASGLDPHITPAAAYYQAGRVAKARNLSLESMKTLIAAHTEGRFLGVLGEPVVNVIALNLALDARKDSHL